MGRKIWAKHTKSRTRYFNFSCCTALAQKTLLFSPFHEKISELLIEFPTSYVRWTYLLKELALMLLAANCARFFLTALVGAIFKSGSLSCVEFRHRRLLKFIGAAGGVTCFKPNVTWSTDSCLRRIFLLSLAGLSFKSIDFCLRNKFFALLESNCCRTVDIFPLLSLRIRLRRASFLLFSGAENRRFSWISWFLLQSNNLLLMLRYFY